DRWEFSLDNRVGAPVGRLQVGEFPPANGSAGGAPGTHLRLSGLGIHVSETVEASAAFHLTPDDAIRASALYEFLRGNGTPRESVVYNGEEFKPGPLHANADFSRFSLAYERVLWRSPVDELVGGLGITYVYFNPTLSGHGHSNSEDFYLQELPVPIAGLRWSRVLGEHWLVRPGAPEREVLARARFSRGIMQPVTTVSARRSSWSESSGAGISSRPQWPRPVCPRSRPCGRSPLIRTAWQEDPR